MPSLVFLRHDEKLMEYRLHGGRTSIGRADSCDIALPGNAISRTHCVIQGRGESWSILDRSRHGTTVNGEQVQHCSLKNGDRIRVGDFEVVFYASLHASSSTTSDLQPARLHEQLLDTSEETLHIQQAALEVVEGPDAGQTLRLDRARLSLGGRGSTMVLADSMLVAEHCRLRIARGRVMLEPGRGAVWFDGCQLRQVTPVYPEETFRIGETTLKLVVGEANLAPEAKRFGEMQGKSAAMRRLFGTLRVLAGHDEPVLIIGESGTGKELTARGLHEHSPRASRPFVSLNCGGLSQQLLHSELFGYEKGAFTGASSRRDGAFQQADGGTLFLDELGELPLEAQATLLRALGGGGIRRVGSFTPEYPDVRVIAATNRDLIQMVRSGEFREDLFFRLETLFIRLPPLRVRVDDIEPLARHFAQQVNPLATLTPDALSVMRSHSWPGNVRELVNVIRRSIISNGPRIEAHHLVFHAIRFSSAGSDLPAMPPVTDLHSREYLQELLHQHGGNRAAAARTLRMSRSTLLYRLKKVGLS